ncbi:hypothetical protein ACF3NG_03845 [Aerococcaceae bacterium WGS1372]
MKINKNFNKKLLATVSILTLTQVAPIISSACPLSIIGVQASSETKVDDIEMIRQTMLESTPIIESQFTQIPEEAWLEYSQQANEQGLDPSAVYNWALRDYPKTFEPAIAHYRKGLVENYNIDEESLSIVSDQELLWLEYNVWMSAGGQEDFTTLAERLVTEYGVEYAEEDNERLANLKQTMLDASPITSEQFDAIEATAWFGYADRVEEGGDPSTVYNWAVEDYPDVFKETITYIRTKLVNEFDINEASLDEVNDIELLWEEFFAWTQAGQQEDFEALSEQLIEKYGVSKDEDSDDENIEQIKAVMIESTPITAEQFDVIPTDVWIDYSKKANEAGVDPSSVYNWAVEDYPEVFKDTADYIRNAMINDYNLDETSLSKISDRSLLWIEFTTWKNAGNKEDLQTVAQILIDEYHIKEVDDDSSAHDEKLERIRRVMLEGTPITEEQFEAIPATSWIAYSDKINEEGGHPATAYNWALRDYPEVFQETVDYLRNELVSNYQLDHESLNQKVSNQQLLWEEYLIWLDKGKKIYRH